MRHQLESDPAPPPVFQEEHRSHRSDILFGFGLLLAIYLAFQVINVLLLVYISALFAVVLAPAIDVVRRIKIGSWRPGRGLAMLVLLLGLLSFVVLFSAFAIPPIYGDAVAMSDNWPARVAEIVNKVPGMKSTAPPATYTIGWQKIHMAAAQGQPQSSPADPQLSGQMPLYTMGLSTNWNSHLLVWYFTSNSIDTLNRITKTTVRFGRDQAAPLYPLTIGNATP